tara:strand:+ start:887 stop:2272 length:1386 start_codon:yes stop_codon:yes gene_type:complete
LARGIVAIVGRPNVGKSTLFNRLTKSRGAIVADRPGVTRDRIYGNVLCGEDQDGHELGFTLVDTGGFETADVCFQPFKKNLVWEQTSLAIGEADLICLMFDASVGVQEYDRELFQYLQKQGKNVLCVANKIDGKEHASAALDFYSLGVDHVYPLSAAHNYGISDLKSEMLRQLEVAGVQTSGKHLFGRADQKESRKIALLGRPNAGKSSILNRLLGEERSLVSDVAGTTRDSVDAVIRYNECNYTVVDTAGVRRRTKVKDRVEVQSVLTSLRNIEEADLVLYVIDAEQGLTDQDSRLINMALERYKPILILVNKWDLIPDKNSNSARDYSYELKRNFPCCAVHFISCKHNQRVHKVLPIVANLFEQIERRVSTAEVNQCLDSLTTRCAPPEVGQRRVRFYYATQVKTAPPTFVLMCNSSARIQASYKRYMVKYFRKELGFEKVPINFIFRSKKEESVKKQG